LRLLILASCWTCADDRRPQTQRAVGVLGGVPGLSLLLRLCFAFGSGRASGPDASLSRAWLPRLADGSPRDNLSRLADRSGGPWGKTKGVTGDTQVESFYPTDVYVYDNGDILASYHGRRVGASSKRVIRSVAACGELGSLSERASRELPSFDSRAREPHLNPGSGDRTNDA
jgi:hypothetical protein